MAKAKKVSLPLNDTNEIINYQAKDLIWAKMKGFTPWPAMICDPPLDLLNQSRKISSRCVFFFGSRNFAWIENNNIKPFEGPWKAELAKVNKTSFKQAMQDINNYLQDPTDVDAEIKKNAAVNHSTEADFDKIRDGVTNDDEANDATVADSANNGDITNSFVTDGLVTNSKQTPKRLPKAKTNTPKVTKSSTKSAPKRRRSSLLNTSANKRVRSRSVSIIENLIDSDGIGDDSSPLPISTSGRRRINPSSLSHIGSTSTSARRNVNSIALLDRPVVNRPEQQAIDINSPSQTLVERDIEASTLIFGFLGLGIMGSTIVKDLICTGHKVIVWNRTISKCQPFVDAGAELRDTPMDVVEAADITFCCVSDPKVSKELVFGNCGVLQVKDLCNKAYVEMSTIDPETSQEISEGITQCNGRYLEVQIHGTRQEAEEGMLIILAGGDRSVFEDCHSCFKTIAKNTFFLGDVGNACKVNLILQTIAGVSLVGLAEAFALADRFSISLKDIIDIFELTSMKSQLLSAKGREMAKGDFNPQQRLSHMQKDLRLVLAMAEHLDQSMPVTATTNEVFKHTKRLGYSDHDSSAVFLRSRF